MNVHKYSKQLVSTMHLEAKSVHYILIHGLHTHAWLERELCGQAGQFVIGTYYSITLANTTKITQSF